MARGHTVDPGRGKAYRPLDPVDGLPCLLLERGSGREVLGLPGALLRSNVRQPVAKLVFERDAAF